MPVPRFNCEGVPSDEESILTEYWYAFAPGDVVLDIGAHLGLYTLPALAQGATVISVEPMPGMCSRLCDNVAKNDGFAARHTAVNAFAYSGQKYPAPLLGHMMSHDPTCASTMVTVDELWNDLDRLDAIKMDVEGGELEVLHGAEGTLERLHPRLILIEDHTGLFGHAWCETHHTGDGCIALLEEHGYRVELRPFHSRRFIVGLKG